MIEPAEAAMKVAVRKALAWAIEEAHELSRIAHKSRQGEFMRHEHALRHLADIHSSPSTEVKP